MQRTQTVTIVTCDVCKVRVDPETGAAIKARYNFSNMLGSIPVDKDWDLCDKCWGKVRTLLESKC